MTPRAVSRIVPAERVTEGAGFTVRRPFPTRAVDHIDPFLLLDHVGPAIMPAGGGHGAPDHPHRGFETVSYILEGALRHEDSTGEGGVLHAGDVQWMTAGSGIVHSELPDPAFYRQGGPMHGLQLWVNLPRRAKRSPPRYQHIPADSVPRRNQDGCTLRVIAGRLDGLEGPVATHTPVTYAHLRLEAASNWDTVGVTARTALLYVIGGRVAVGPDARPVAAGDLAVLGPGDGLVVQAASPSDVLVLLGEPLDEAVVRYGPFVMNTEAEIHEAMADFRAGRLGRIARGA